MFYFSTTSIQVFFMKYFVFKSEVSKLQPRGLQYGQRPIFILPENLYKIKQTWQIENTKQKQKIKDTKKHNAFDVSLENVDVL